MRKGVRNGGMKGGKKEELEGGGKEERKMVTDGHTDGQTFL